MGEALLQTQPLVSKYGIPLSDVIRIINAYDQYAQSYEFLPTLVETVCKTVPLMRESGQTLDDTLFLITNLGPSEGCMRKRSEAVSTYMEGIKNEKTTRLQGTCEHPLRTGATFCPRCGIACDKIPKKKGQIYFYVV